MVEQRRGEIGQLEHGVGDARADHGIGHGRHGRGVGVLDQHLAALLVDLDAALAILDGSAPRPALDPVVVAEVRKVEPHPTRSGLRLVTVDRDPLHALGHHGVGFTDLVARATPAISDLARGEFRAGAARLERLVARTGARLVCFVGLAGYREAVDRNARAGLQPEPFGGALAYVMPSTSGLNASSQIPDLAEHLAAADRLAGG